MGTSSVDVLVRPAEEADFPALQRIFRRASLGNPGDRATLEAHPEVLELSHELIPLGRTRVAALADGTVIGFAGTSVVAEDVLELDDLFVDPDWQRRGAARRLLAEIVAEAMAEGYRRIEVDANPHAMDFYRSAGFQELGPADLPFGAGMRMHLALRSDA